MNTPSLIISRRGSFRLLGAAGWASLVGCHRASETGGRRFAVSFQTMNNPFFVELDEGLRAAVEAQGGRLLTLDARHDSHKQRNDLSDALQQRPPPCSSTRSTGRGSAAAWSRRGGPGSR